MSEHKRNVLVFEDRKVFSKAAAELVLNRAKEAVSSAGRFYWVLSGGGTPRPMYELLAREPYLSAIPWAHTHCFWGDERCVPPDHAESNYGQAQRLFLDRAPVRPEYVYRIRGELEPELAAADYREQLRLLAESDHRWPTFDLVLLGMGDDGHTASLFPGPISEEERRLPAIAVTADYAGRPANRVSLTPPVFNSARSIAFLVTGSGKAPTVASVLGGPIDKERWPAQRIRPGDGIVTWLLDEAAAAKLHQGDNQHREQ